ncbi:hypothetical protein CVT25_009043 [Psilocybe cyanescens]|uniref:Uncharacterized protein n=1 Tax=Psilocybe cyanescens TaxID=93625 RepID=A0A409XCW6_PSICY|nr:hypothetical protein CVT25_009043 [Psilocybe cyanescens]
MYVKDIAHIRKASDTAAPLTADSSALSTRKVFKYPSKRDFDNIFSGCYLDLDLYLVECFFMDTAFHLYEHDFFNDIEDVFSATLTWGLTKLADISTSLV